MNRLLILCTLLAASLLQLAHAAPMVLPPDNALAPAQLGLVVNDRDFLSATIADEYRKARQIPPENVVHVQFDPGVFTLEPGAFAQLKAQVDRQLPAAVQAIALTWAAPYRVGCMSITSAFAFGYEARYCAKGCAVTAISPYFDSPSRAPFTDLRIRPTIMLAARTPEQAQALIERGIAADRNVTAGNAWLIETQDKARSARKPLFTMAQLQLGTRLPIHSRKTEAIENQTDVMFYFTGATRIAGIASNRYLPGAVADHLTSFGGQLTNSSQMSALEWLEGGLTGSYGTVVEPCAFAQKFPNPAVMMSHYLDGETLIESYWKSVEMPGQGVFIGEPLARPYASYDVRQVNGKWEISGVALKPGSYQLWGSDRIDGEFKLIRSGLDASPFSPSLEIPEPLHRFYRVKLLK